MAGVRIIHFDDDERVRAKLSISFKLLNKQNNNMIDEKYYKNHFYTTKEEINNYISTSDDWDIVILDIYDSNGDRADIDILDILQTRDLKNKNIFMYSSTNPKDTRRNEGVNFTTLYKDYPFISVPVITKGDEGALRARIRDVCLVKDEPIYDIDEYDEVLQSEIELIGKTDLNNLLSQISITLDSDNLHISKMTSGLSGAFVLKLKANNKEFVLKVSKDKDKLEDELNRAKQFYKYIDVDLRLDISDNTLYKTNKLFAFLIELIPDAATLFDTINSSSHTIIQEKLRKLYFISNLKKLYTYEQEGQKYFTDIFKRFDKSWKVLINDNIDVLKPIWSNGDLFTEEKFEINQLKDFLNYVIHINPSSSTPPQNLSMFGLEGIVKKNVVLSHGDFHAKNILVREGDKNLKIIDTGNMDYHYWCLDISRLIVYLLLYGADNQTFSFYNHSHIPDYYEMAKDIIDGKQIQKDINGNEILEMESGQGFLVAINWLVENVQLIYPDFYCKWEFQLGLMKEFIHQSCRDINCSSSKKTLGLISASYALQQAKNELEKIN